MSKRKTSSLIPYKRIGANQFTVYLQKRSTNISRFPDFFGLFGGGAEPNETPEETLKRESKEELDFVPEHPIHFKTYEFKETLEDVFIFEAENDFEKNITILEGEYGEWFGNEIIENPKLVPDGKIILKDLFDFLSNRQD